MTNALAEAPSAPDQTLANYAIIPRDQLHESPKNPRKHFDAAKLQELANSIREHGVLTPLLARPCATDKRFPAYELAAGHRRYRAAKIAGLTELPVVVREMTDTQLLEILTIENLQRDDVHPLEEAQGYADLIKDAGYSAARIGERVGKSEKYVYDRIKLLQLVPQAKKVFMEGLITAGHAILLARLKKEDQVRAMDPDDSGSGYRTTGLWENENTLWDPTEDDKRKGKRDAYEGLKAVSVREFEGWIDEHVRIDVKHDADPMLLPGIVDVAQAREMKLRVVPITYEHVLPNDARSDERTYGEKSWRRADGKEKSKTCEYAVLGYVAAGPNRGDAFKVCVRRDKCTVHWAAEVAAAKKREKERARTATSASAKSDAKAEARAAAEAAKQAEEDARIELEAARWKRAKSKVVDRLVKHIKSAPTGAKKDQLGQLVVDKVSDWNGLELRDADVKIANKYFPGTSAEDLVRWLVCGIVVPEIQNEYSEFDDQVEICKDIGFDLKKTLDDIEPLPKPEKSSSAKKKARR